MCLSALLIFYLFAEDFGMGAVRTAGRSAAPAAVGTRMDTKVPTLVNPVSFIPNLAQTRDRRPLRKEERQLGYRCVSFANYSQFTDNVLLHIPATLRRRDIPVSRNSLVWWLRTAPANISVRIRFI